MEQSNKIKTGIYINEKNQLVDLIGWGTGYTEYPIIGILETKSYGPQYMLDLLNKNHKEK